jgi:hypothetical protein
MQRDTSQTFTTWQRTHNNNIYKPTKLRDTTAESRHSTRDCNISQAYRFGIAEPLNMSKHKCRYHTGSALPNGAIFSRSQLIKNKIHSQPNRFGLVEPFIKISNIQIAISKSQCRAKLIHISYRNHIGSALPNH